MSVICHTLVDNKSVSNVYNGGFDIYCDILVVGLGTAGSVAAITAASRGYKVVGINVQCFPAVLERLLVCGITILVQGEDFMRI